MTKKTVNINQLFTQAALAGSSQAAPDMSHAPRAEDLESEWISQSKQQQLLLGNEQQQQRRNEQKVDECKASDSIPEAPIRKTGVNLMAAISTPRTSLQNSSTTESSAPSSPSHTNPQPPPSPYCQQPPQQQQQQPRQQPPQYPSAPPPGYLTASATILSATSTLMDGFIDSYSIWIHLLESSFNVRRTVGVGELKKSKRVGAHGL
jgi:hypothetical protein